MSSPASSVSGVFGVLPTEAFQAFMEWTASSPEFLKLYLRFLADVAALWRFQLERESDKSISPPPVVTPSAGDRRFAGPDWDSSPFYDFLRQYYLLVARFLSQAVDAVNLPPHQKGQLRFFARQYIDALSPTNFAATNPEALKAAVSSKGETLRRGLEQFVEDAAKGRISTVDDRAFEVGRNLAVTPGGVVYENPLFQLIQFQPVTAQVYRRPLLIVPPCINKYYILDLSPENSFVRFAVEQGHTVFILSWRNPRLNPAPVPGESEPPQRPSDPTPLDQYTWDDYIEQGVITAIRTVLEISGEERIDALGFCVGGTLIANALAVLAARGEHPAATLTLLASFLDFSDTGEIGLFVDERSVRAREEVLGNGGLLSGRELAQVFSALRDNDLIWPYVVNNYLKGHKPAAFDILYWNADSTNLPGPMYCWYLRNMYLNNFLREPGRLEVCGERVDLSSIDAPAYVVATREDHIVPWRSAYASTQLLHRHGTEDQAVDRNRFVLGASGHIAGIINPPSHKRRSYWMSDSLPPNPDEWLVGAREYPGSWWNDWITWLSEQHGSMKPAPSRLGDEHHAVIEPAPGRYVKVPAG